MVYFQQLLARQADVALYLVGIKSEQNHLASWQACERTDPALTGLSSWQLIKRLPKLADGCLWLMNIFFN